MSFSQVKAKLENGIFNEAVASEAAKVLDSPINGREKDQLITFLFFVCSNNLHQEEAVKLAVLPRYSQQCET